ISNHSKYQSILNEIEKLKRDLETIQPIQNDELIALKKQTQLNIEVVKKQLSVVDQIEAANKRINDLRNEESSLSNSLLELEKIEFDIEKFIKLKTEAIEEQINNKFKIVKF